MLAEEVKVASQRFGEPGRYFGRSPMRRLILKPAIFASASLFYDQKTVREGLQMSVIRARSTHCRHRSLEP